MEKPVHQMFLASCFSNKIGQFYRVSEGLTDRLREGMVRDPINWLLSDITLKEREDINCLVIIIDPYYSGTLQEIFLKSILYIPVFIVSNLFELFLY